MSLRDDLIAAKALIDTPEKWRKDARIDQDGCCAVVAVGRVSGFHWEPATDALHDALPDEWQLGGERQLPDEDDIGLALGCFNDDPDTTHADVMALFDRAIAAAPEA